ncbi:MAG: hypothetical protein Q9159_000245 [Coniocarpon cinnabarinum]
MLGKHPRSILSNGPLHKQPRGRRKASNVEESVSPHVTFPETMPEIIQTTSYTAQHFDLFDSPSLNLSTQAEEVNVSPRPTATELCGQRRMPVDESEDSATSMVEQRKNTKHQIKGMPSEGSSAAASAPLPSPTGSSTEPRHYFSSALALSNSSSTSTTTPAPSSRTSPPQPLRSSAASVWESALQPRAGKSTGESAGASAVGNSAHFGQEAFLAEAVKRAEIACLERDLGDCGLS